MNYEYGKEYECNGVRPDLPGDVLVRQYYEGDWMSMVRAVEKWLSWNGVSKFRIEDERYKPEPEQGWYDYENQNQRDGCNPPVGVTCESYDFNVSRWEKVKTLDAITRSGDMACVTTSESGAYGMLFFGCKFRPLDWDRELKRELDRLFNSAFVQLRAAGRRWINDDTHKVVKDLIDAGWRPQEQKK